MSLQNTKGVLMQKEVSWLSRAISDGPTFKSSTQMLILCYIKFRKVHGLIDIICVFNCDWSIHIFSIICSCAQFHGNFG